MLPTPAMALRARFAPGELDDRRAHRPAARPTLPPPASFAVRVALAILEVQAGARSAQQLERVCHASLWERWDGRLRRSGGPSLPSRPVLRVWVQEHSPGLVDAVVVVVRRGGRVQPLALRLDGGRGRWEVVGVQY